MMDRGGWIQSKVVQVYHFPRSCCAIRFEEFRSSWLCKFISCGRVEAKRIFLVLVLVFCFVCWQLKNYPEMNSTTVV